eukprot:756427-Hanusia_phi.AAC.2
MTHDDWMAASRRQSRASKGWGSLVDFRAAAYQSRGVAGVLRYGTVLTGSLGQDMCTIEGLPRISDGTYHSTVGRPGFATVTVTGCRSLLSSGSSPSHWRGTGLPAQAGGKCAGPLTTVRRHGGPAAGTPGGVPTRYRSTESRVAD